MTTKKRIMACDCETDPFAFGRIPKPFLWGLYDGKDFVSFDNTADFVQAVINKPVILYAHNGGKFDFMYLLSFVGETKMQVINGRIISMMLGRCELRDSLAAVPVSMKSIQKKEIDMWKLEANVRDKHMAEIIEYNKYDCIYLYDLMLEYRKNAGRFKTIASNALAFAKKQGIDTGKTNARFDANYREFYYGGRTEVFRAGTHENITILDIHSAYPFAMMHEHPTGSEFNRCSSLDGFTDDEISRCLITIECTAHGCFPLRAPGPLGGLIFPHEYNEYSITGWEYLVAKEFGLIENEKIISVAYTNQKINFRDYVLHWFKYKQDHPKKKDPINYTIGKIMLNSLYGKLAQNPASYFDYKIVYGGSKTCSVADHSISCDCEGWKIYSEFEGHEIHRRESLWKYKFEYGVEWKGKNLYHNVATAASITGFTRAHLLRAIHTIGIDHVIYSDTDSLICDATADISKLPLTDNLGDWDIEDRNAPIGHFAGKKLYGIRLSTGEDKIASKGSKLTFNDLEKIINGETITWKNDAPTFAIDGTAQFVVREIKSTVQKRTVPTLSER